MPAAISVPSSSAIPVARPPRTRILATGVPVSDLHPGRAPGGGDRVADGAHAAHHMAEEALHRILAAGQQVEGEPEQRARLVRAAVLAVQVVGQQQRLGLPGLEPRVDELAEAAGQQPGEPVELASRARRACRCPSRSSSAQAAQPRRPGVRRHLHEQRLQPACQGPQLGVARR